MDVFSLLIVLVVLGIARYFLEPYVKDPFRTILVVVVVLLFCVWLLSFAGIGPGLRLR